jgi:hypothetical protein
VGLASFFDGYVEQIERDEMGEEGELGLPGRRMERERERRKKGKRRRRPRRGTCRPAEQRRVPIVPREDDQIPFFLFKSATGCVGPAATSN